MERKASVRWNGSLQKGEGRVSSASGAIQNMKYGFKTRFADEPGTNPEELIAAAHASCFTMALSGQLGKAGFEPKELRTIARVSLDKDGDDWKVGSSRLSVEAEVPGIDEDKFMELANYAKANCPISKLLNAEITLDAKLVLAEQAAEPVASH